MPAPPASAATAGGQAPDGSRDVPRRHGLPSAGSRVGASTKEAEMAWVRVASFDGGDTDKLRERAESGAMPDNPPGMQGAMVFATPDGSKRVFVAWFDSKESL